MATFCFKLLIGRVNYSFVKLHKNTFLETEGIHMLILVVLGNTKIFMLDILLR